MEARPTAMASDSSRPATARKRQAAAALRDLAAELAIGKRGRNADLNKADFADLCNAVMAACATPEQRGRAEAARQLYDGDGTDVAVAKLPAVPALPQLPVAIGPGPVGVPVPKEGAPVLPEVPGPRNAAPSAAATGGGSFRLRGGSCLFTYNSPLFRATAAGSLWEAFLEFLTALHCAAKWTATMEQSLHSQVEDRVHLHVCMEFTKPVDWTTLEPVRFRNSRPDARPTIARGENQKDVVNHGHFYVYAQKEGTLHVATSGWVPWRDYAVKGWWIDELWAAHKLSHATYLEYAAKVRIGFVGRLRQLRAVEDEERGAALKERQLRAAARLVPLTKDFLPEIVERLRPWRKQYSADAMRFNFLVLRGVSRSGKSSLAKALGELLGLGLPFIQTAQSASAADLKNFSNDRHGYIVFDNVNHHDFVLSQRALFQANTDIHTLAGSKNRHLCVLGLAVPGADSRDG